MEVLKAELFELLKTLGYTVYQQRPDVIRTVPCITFFMSSNVNGVGVKNDIQYQEQEYDIDIWTETGAETTEIAKEVDELLRESGYISIVNLDIPDEKYSRMNMRYKLII
jgi:hypothetical protein